MADITLQFSSGMVSDLDSIELSDPQYAVVSKNVTVTDSGAVSGRPGLTRFATIGSFGVIGLFFFNELVFAVTSDRRMYQVGESGAVTDVTGSVLEGTGRPHFASDGTYLAIAGGGAPRRWSGSGDTSLLAGSPVNTKHIVYLDGYWILPLIDDQEFRWAGPTSALRATWTSSNFFQAEGLPDDVVTCAVLERELYVFGKDSTEVFSNYGDSSVPFRRTFFIDRGIGAEASVIQADNTLWLLDDERHFVTLQGRTPVNVSTPKIDSVIQGLTTVTDCWGWKIDIDGKYLIGWTFPAEERTFVFDYKNKKWFEWDGFRDGLSDRFRAHSHCYAKSWNKHLIGDFRTGTIWQLSKDAYADGDLPRRILIRTGHIDHGTGMKKRNKRYRFHVKRGLGVSGGTEPQFQVRFRDDGSQWGPPYYFGLGAEGDNEHTIDLFNTGLYRKRQIEVSMTDAVPFLLPKVEEDVEVLSV